MPEPAISPFRLAVEQKSAAALSAALAEDAVFHSPAVHAAYEGRTAVVALLEVVLSVFDDFQYPWTMRDGDREVLFFTARVGERDIEGVDLVRYGADGRVQELTVMIRPLSGLTAVRDAVGARLAARP